MAEFLYRELSYQTIGAALEVHKILGPGFLETVYELALAHELTLRGVSVRRQAGIEVTYKGKLIGDYRADFVIDGKMILEVKALSALTPVHEAQAHHYLVATDFRLAILFNFGSSSLEIKRIIR